MTKAEWKLKMDSVRAAAIAAGATYTTRYTEPRVKTLSTKFWWIGKLEIWLEVAKASCLDYTVVHQWGGHSIRFRAPKTEKE